MSNRLGEHVDMQSLALSTQTHGSVGMRSQRRAACNRRHIVLTFEPGVTTLGICGSILWACCAHNMQCNPWRAHGLYHPSDVSAAFSTLPSSSANVHESAGSAESAKLPATARRYSAGGTIRRALPDSRGEYSLFTNRSGKSLRTPRVQY